MGEERSTKVQLSPLLRAALSSRQPGEDVDEAILRAAKAAHPEHAAMLLGVAVELIATEMKRTGEAREQVVERLAGEESGPDIAVRSAGIGPLHVNLETAIYRVGGKEYHSLDELPPNIRRAVEATLARRRPELPEARPTLREDDRRSVRMGCSTALLAALWRLVSR